MGSITCSSKSQFIYRAVEATEQRYPQFRSTHPFSQITNTQSNQEIIQTSQSSAILRFCPIFFQRWTIYWNIHSPKTSKVRSHRQSVHCAGNTATEHTKSIINWFYPVTEQTSATLQQHPQDNLVNDAYSKKKRHRSESAPTNRRHQPRLIGYMSLRQAL